ncbi:platelet glycoprotein Ib alpha chain-like isoform X2 [Mya arenaria]|nr:platelet glycoprotein Ib alpha chain-like isoform X2 [Mya arenaria]
MTYTPPKTLRTTTRMGVRTPQRTMISSRIHSLRPTSGVTASQKPPEKHTTILVSSTPLTTAVPLTLKPVHKQTTAAMMSTPPTPPAPQTATAHVRTASTFRPPTPPSVPQPATATASPSPANLSLEKITIILFAILMVVSVILVVITSRCMFDLKTHLTNAQKYSPLQAKTVPV